MFARIPFTNAIRVPKALTTFAVSLVFFLAALPAHAQQQDQYRIVWIGHPIVIIVGLILVLLAAIGVAGVMAFLVAQRTQEMGIRMALGAQRSDVFGLVLGQGLRMAFLGLLIGLAGAFGLTHLISGMLYGVRPGDPLTFALVSAFLVGVAFVACWLPARSATRVDPMVALRYE